MPEYFRSTLPRLIMTFLFFALLTAPTFAGDGPSFDCSKAKTEVEKLICGSSELSKMDLELSETYSNLASGLGDAEKANLKKEQIEWIKGRSKKIEEGILPDDKPEDVFKKKEANLKKEYQARIEAIKKQLEKLPVNDAVAGTEKIKDQKTAESSNLKSDIPPPVKTEAEKAQRVKAILDKYKLDFKPRYSNGTAKFCNEFYNALKTADKSIEYIEPVLRTDDPNHPELKEYHSCDDKESYDDDEQIYNNIHMIGDKGFRLYRLDLDGNPKNGLEEYIYGENDSKSYGPQQKGIDGYKKVDFEECRIVSFIIGHPYEGAAKWKKENYNAMIRYKGHYYIYDLHDDRLSDISQPSYQLELYQFLSMKQLFEGYPGKIKGIWD